MSKHISLKIHCNPLTFCIWTGKDLWKRSIYLQVHLLLFSIATILFPEYFPIWWTFISDTPCSTLISKLASYRANHYNKWNNSIVSGIGPAVVEEMKGYVSMCRCLCPAAHTAPACQWHVPWSRSYKYRIYEVNSYKSSPHKSSYDLFIQYLLKNAMFSLESRLKGHLF